VYSYQNVPTPTTPESLRGGERRGKGGQTYGGEERCGGNISQSVGRACVSPQKVVNSYISTLLDLAFFAATKWAAARSESAAGKPFRTDHRLDYARGGSRVQAATRPRRFFAKSESARSIFGYKEFTRRHSACKLRRRRNSSTSEARNKILRHSPHSQDRDTRRIVMVRCDKL